MNFMDKLTQIYSEPPRKDFDYLIGQKVRILKTLTIDTHAIKDLLGTNGAVAERYTTGLRKDNKYVVVFPNGRKETFDEEELDKRLIKKWMVQDVGLKAN